MSVDTVTFAKTLADETRQEIITHLCCTWLSVNDVVDKLNGKVNQLSPASFLRTHIDTYQCIGEEKSVDTINRAHTEILWQSMNTALKSFIAKRVGDESSTDDILQDVFLRVHSRVDGVKNAAKLESWMYQIARNAIIDYYRRKKTEQPVVDTLGVDDVSDDVDMEKQLAPCLRGMIEELPRKYREALLLTEYERLTQIQLAQRLGISVSGAKSRVQRAREYLKQALFACCHFEFDRFGKIVDYYPHRCTRGKPCPPEQSACQSVELPN